jgi:hypothetical protein
MKTAINPVTSFLAFLFIAAGAAIAYWIALGHGFPRPSKSLSTRGSG